MAAPRMSRLYSSSSFAANQADLGLVQEVRCRVEFIEVNHAMPPPPRPSSEPAGAARPPATSERASTILADVAQLYGPNCPG